MLFIANHLDWREDPRRQAAWISPHNARRLPSLFTFGASHQWQAPSGASDELFCSELLTRQDVLARLDNSAATSLVTNGFWANFLSRILEREIECANSRARPFYLDREDLVLRVHLCGERDLRSINAPIFQALDNPDAMETRGEIRFFLHFLRPKSWLGSAS